MTTIEDFRNAPVGATATHKETGVRAVKMGSGERCWVLRNGVDVRNELMERWGFTLDPTAPTTMCGALDLAWALDLLEEAFKVSPPTIETTISTNPRTTRLYDIAGYAVLIDSETLNVVTIGHVE